ncbi:MAG TPA: FAD-dependent monooxygenase [Tepidisphaeraceae bacterium]|nr:FAD-dependent monooxygenase [Tepidisphaeraceae bacterium]
MNGITIIGAGPAGSAAAILLARAGKTPTLIEQHRFPRDKVCGECVSALGIDVLDRLGITPMLRTAGAASLTRAMIHAGDAAPLETDLPRRMVGISRHVLDALLLDTARQAGARVMQPARCEAVFPGAVPSLRVRDLKTNESHTFGAALLLLADGKSALPDAPPGATGDIGVKSHWINVDGPRDAIELFGCAGCYGGLASIEGGRWNAAFSIPAARARAHHGDLDALFAELMSQSPALSRRLRNATRGGPWLASPLPRFGVQSKWPPGLIPIGNAAAALEPIGGEGMGLALRSAEIAAAAIIAAGDCWSAQNERALRRAYNALWRMRRLACRATAMIVSSKSAADAALALSRNNPSLAKLAMAWMGK